MWCFLKVTSFSTDWSVNLKNIKAVTCLCSGFIVVNGLIWGSNMLWVCFIWEHLYYSGALWLFARLVRKHISWHKENSWLREDCVSSTVTRRETSELISEVSVRRWFSSEYLKNTRLTFVRCRSEHEEHQQIFIFFLFLRQHETVYLCSVDLTHQDRCDYPTLQDTYLEI